MKMTRGAILACFLDIALIRAERVESSEDSPLMQSTHLSELEGFAPVVQAQEDVGHYALSEEDAGHISKKDARTNIGEYYINEMKLSQEDAGHFALSEEDADANDERFNAEVAVEEGAEDQRHATYAQEQAKDQRGKFHKSLVRNGKKRQRPEVEKVKGGKKDRKGRSKLRSRFALSEEDAGHYALSQENAPAMNEQGHYYVQEAAKEFPAMAAGHYALSQEAADANEEEDATRGKYKRIFGLEEEDATRGKYKRIFGKLAEEDARLTPVGHNFARLAEEDGKLSPVVAAAEKGHHLMMDSPMVAAQEGAKAKACGAACSTGRKKQESGGKK